MSFDEFFNVTFEFRDCELIKQDKGNVVIKTIVNKTNVNPYGKAHGGYLYTLCDSLAGVVGYTLGHYYVTLQANINYMKAVNLNDELYLEGKCIHEGGTTAVIEIEIKNNDASVAKGQFTLFKIGEVEIQ